MYLICSLTLSRAYVIIVPIRNLSFVGEPGSLIKSSIQALMNFWLFRALLFFLQSLFNRLFK